MCRLPMPRETTKLDYRVNQTGLHLAKEPRLLMHWCGQTG